MEVRDTAAAIEELDRTVDGIFRGLRMVPGSICRISGQYLRNWGIVVNGATKVDIQRLSLESYLDEWRRSGPQFHQAINTATTKAGIAFNNRNLNETLAGKAVDIIEGHMRTQRPYRILDIGAGDGATSLAVLNAMKAVGTDKKVLSTLCFDLLDVSEDALSEAKKKVEQRAAVGGTFATTLQNYLEMVPDGFYDMAISTAVLHHMTFPDYLAQLNRKLAPDGVMIVGDWHTTIWSHPVFMVPIMNALGANYGRVRGFEMLFNIKKGDYERLFNALPPEERESNRLMLAFEQRLADELNGPGGRALLCILEGHESLAERVSQYRDNGFETDIEELRAKHRGFARMSRNINRLRGMDLATVVAMAKIPQRRASMPA